jgi:hypothetical protein
MVIAIICANLECVRNNLECMAKITLNKITIMHIRDLFLYLNQLLPPVYIQINHAGSNNEFSAGFSIFEQR